MKDLGRYVRVVYRTRGQIVHDEVLCRRCFEEMRLRGAFRSERGKTIEFEPWVLEPRCGGCDTAEDLRTTTGAHR